MAGTVKSKGKGVKKGAAALAAEVFERDLCSICGACVGHCPYFIHTRGRVSIRDRCTLDQGRCYDFCPMAGAKGRFEGELGNYREVFIAQATGSDVLKKAQYGGVVSTLVGLALNQGLVEEAVLTSGDPEEAPEGVRVNSWPRILASAGTRFSASGSVAALNQALAEPAEHPLALVGVPCQIKAAAAMRNAKGEDLNFQPKRIKLLIGLFCTWALDFRRLSDYLRIMLFGERPSRYDIPPPPADVFKVFTSDGIKAFPLNEIRDLTLKACGFCDDMTGTRADISVGAVEGLEAWNTVIVRTPVGQKLVDLARDRKLLVTDTLPAVDLDHLKEAAALKKDRAKTAWAKEG